MMRISTSLLSFKFYLPLNLIEKMFTASHVFPSAEMQPEFFHDPDKKATIQFQPDLTQSNITMNYDYPPLGSHHHGHLNGTLNSNVSNANIEQSIPLQIPRSISEHHYDVPHLSNT